MAKVRLDVKCRVANVFIKSFTHHQSITKVKTKQRKVPNHKGSILRGIIHNLSLQRWQDQEITDYLNNEKGITLSRSSVTHIRIEWRDKPRNGTSN